MDEPFPAEPRQVVDTRWSRNQEPGVPPALPFPRTTLVGREREIEYIAALIRQDEVPLCTLTGPGGVGKTRLALAVAARVAPEFPDGAIFVPLETIRDPDLVIPAIAHALRLGDRNSRPATANLIEYLRPRRTLLVLDNMEHVINAGPSITELLVTCPHLKILATSRVVLHVSGSHDVAVAPLATPNLLTTSTINEIRSFPAVELFIARARAVNSAFDLNDGNAQVVAAICGRLDGLPLALELAAARVLTLPPIALLARLERVLPMLTSGARDLPERLHTMRDAIAWSYNLLTEAEQRLFRRASVFVGGFGLEGASAVYGRDALDGVASLMEKSLLQQALAISDAEPRFRMLETVREFGLEQLRSSGEERMVRAAHLAYVLALAEDAHERLFSTDFDLVVTLVDAEHDNVRAALAWAEDAGEAQLGLRMANAMLYYWIVRGVFRDGRRYVELALELADSQPTSARARAHMSAGWLAWRVGDLDGATSHLTTAVSMAESIGDSEDLALALNALGNVALQHGDLDQAGNLFEHALALFLELEPAPAEGEWLLSLVHMNLARVALAQGDIASATNSLARVEKARSAFGRSWGESNVLRALGDLAHARGEYHQALATYQQSLRLARDDGERRALTDIMVRIAMVAVAIGRPERATRLFAAAAIRREQLGVPRGWDHPPIEHAEHVARVTLSPEAFEAAWSAGATMSFANATIEALTDLDPPHDQVMIPTSFEPAMLTSLTPRERQVLLLLTTGQSDREIAEALFISPRTVGGHVSNLLGKLGVESRTAAATWAIRNAYFTEFA